MEFTENLLFEYLKKAFGFRKQILIAGGSMLLLAVLFVGYSMRQQGREERAHKAWVELYKDFVNAPVDTNADPERATINTFSTANDKWKATVHACEQAYNQHSGTHLAPYFLAVQADALLNQTPADKVGAVALLDRMLKNVGVPAMRDTYLIKKALIELDIPEKEAQGVKTLTVLAGQESHFLQDYVLYQLGAYYWTKMKWLEVKNYWNMLLLKYSETATVPSVWASLVKEKLNLITSE